MGHDVQKLYDFLTQNGLVEKPALSGLEPRKLCVDCKWIEKQDDKPVILNPKCCHPKFRSLVDGKPALFCAHLRQKDCGKDGKFWEAK
jgi:hypothetical protein